MRPISLSPSGILAARFIKAGFAGDGDMLSAAGFSEGRGWRQDGVRLASICRAAVSALSQTELAEIFQRVSADLNAFISTKSTLLRLRGVRRVMQGVRVIAGTGGADAKFIREGAPIQIGKLDLEAATLPLLKIASARVVSRELLRFGNGTDALLRDEIGNSVARGLDFAAFSPDNVGVAGETPASLFSQGTEIAPAATLDSVLEALIAVVTATGSDLSAATWIMTPATATRLASMRGTGGSFAYPEVTATGGTLFGLPVAVTTGMRPTVSPATAAIGLIDGDQVLLADDGDMALSTSESAPLQFDDDPATGATTMISLFANNLAAVKSITYINWALRRPRAAAAARVGAWT